MNESFLFNSIRKYNLARRQTQRDVILHAVGVHCKVLKVKRSPLPVLSQEERDRVLECLREFLRQQEVEVLLK